VRIATRLIDPDYYADVGRDLIRTTWYCNGVWHRHDGPAVRDWHPDGSGPVGREPTCWYYYRGRFVDGPEGLAATIRIEAMQQRLQDLANRIGA